MIMLRDFHSKTVGYVIKVILPAVFFTITQPLAAITLDELESGMNELIYNISQSIVTVEATEPIYPNNYSGVENEAIYSVISTGIIFDSLGLILTLAQSVVDKPLIVVKFESQTIPAKIIAVDYQTGLALLQVVKPVGQPVNLSIQTGCAGEMVLAVGNSMGLRASPSIGFCAGFRPDGYMQFSAQFTSGTHGGGLFDLSGELVGVVFGSLPGDNHSQVGLSLPISKVIETIRYLLKNGSRDAGYLGLTTIEIEISPPLAISTRRGLKTISSSNLLIDKGVVITDIVPNSPASKAGFIPSDLLFEINGKLISSAVDLAEMIKTSRPGSIIEVGVIRHHQPHYFKAVIGQKKLTMVVPVSDAAIKVTRDDLINDTILKEITKLRNDVKKLEERFNGIR